MNIGFIGCGNMGGALARAISKKMGTSLYIFDINQEKADAFASEIGAKSVSREELISRSDFIFLGVKPNMILSLISEISPNLNKGTVLISMAAGVKLERLTASAKGDIGIIRIMPNTPVTLGCGMTAWCKNDFVTDDAAGTFCAFMEATGKIDLLPEGEIDAFCAIAGCGPAYAYMFIDALASAGEACGLSRERAILYASVMLKGSAMMALDSGKDPETLRDNVCSPGGSTIEGVKVLDAGGFDELIAKTIAAAYKKTIELGKDK